MPPQDIDSVIPGSSYIIHDSGKRQEFGGGMVRDIEEGKVDYTLITDGPMFDRWAVHLTKGAVKYSARNWMKAGGIEEYERFRKSAFRHFRDWMRDKKDEDHAAAVFFNINGAEYVQAKWLEGPSAASAVVRPIPQWMETQF